MASGPVEVMSIDELAEYLKISRSTLYKLAQEGGLPAKRSDGVGGSTRAR